MTEAIRHYEEDYDDGSWSDDNELSTSYLSAQQPGSAAGASAAPRPSTDWLVLLTRGEHDTAAIEDVEPPPPPTPEGMAHHTAAPGMRPTVLTRVSGSMRRLTALAVFLVLLAAALIASASLVVSTPWASSLITPQAPAKEAGTQQAATRPVPAKPAPPVAAQPVQPAQPAQAAPPPAPGSVQDLQQRGNAAYKAGDYEQAIDLLDNAIQMGGDDAVTYYQLGLAYLAATGRAHSGDDAELAFRSAASLQPGWSAPYQMLAESLIRRGFYQDAIEPAQKAIDLDGAKADAWITLGRALDGAGKKADAAKAYAQAQKLSPAPPANP